MIKNVNWSSCKVPVVIEEILMKLEFSRHFFSAALREMLQYEISPSRSRVVPCGRTDAQTNTKKLIVAFRKYANAPKHHSVIVI